MSITSAVRKIRESIIMDIIVAYMNNYYLYSDCQHGFSKHTSCVTQLLYVVEDLSDMFDNGDPCDIIYLDFKKAFDQVPISIYLLDLKRCQIKGETEYSPKSLYLHI